MMADDSVAVREASSADAQAWDAFVVQNDSATFFHRYGWATVIEQTFGHTARYLLAERDGTLAGVLPLIHKRSPLFGDALISNAFCSYGGVAAIDLEATRALETRAEQLAEQLDVHYLEFRNMTPARDDWIRKAATYATFRKKIESNREEIIKAVPSKGRRHELRKSLRHGLRFEIHDDVDDFYRVLAESYRNLGTPVYPQRYFRNLLEMFGSDFEICVVRGADGPLSASMAFSFKDHVHPFYAGGTSAARRCQANDFLFLNIMCRASERGYATFDFGRSKVGTGSYNYKTYWGFKPQALAYEYRLVKAHKVPDLNPLNPKYRILVKAWRRLPVSVSKLIGPRIVGHIG